MIKVENIEVFGFEGALRGMRNPLNSWDKADSNFYFQELPEGRVEERMKLGENDLKLSNTLCTNGPEHRKFLRMMHVQMDVVAPLYWWKEYDTYKVGTTANSCSTMHTIADKEFTLDDFSCEHLIDDLDVFGMELCCDDGEPTNVYIIPKGLLQIQIHCLNEYRKLYKETKDKIWWWQMIQSLPSSYNQRRTLDFSYENVFNMINQRKNHKLDEWKQFVAVLENLPMVKELMSK